MGSILDQCAGAPCQEFAAGTVLLSEGETSGRLFILAEGSFEVLRGDTQVAVVVDPGAVFGEMSVLVNRPHTATVRAKSPVRAFVFDDAESFLKSNPEIAFFLGRLLAERLNAATTYLVDLKRQFAGQGNHLGMVGEVLETLIHQHEEFAAGWEPSPILVFEPVREGFEPGHRPLERRAKSDELIACGREPQRLADFGIDNGVGWGSTELLPCIEHPGRADAIHEPSLTKGD
jgi:CRP/FNR family transcriptional regulator, cyclic AMP receptor protein